MRILILEDDEAFAETLRLEFTEAGCEVRIAGALRELREAPDFIPSHAIVDLRLGASSGLEAISYLREQNPEARIVVLTGYGSIATAVKAIKLGADEYLTKPVRTSVLMETLHGEARQDEACPAEPVQSLHEHERDFVEAILLQCGGNVSAAARRLGIHRQSLQRKLRKFSS